MKSYIVTEGPHYCDGYPRFVCKTKKIAVQRCRNDGYKYSRKDDLWSDEVKWRVIEEIEYYD